MTHEEIENLRRGMLTVTAYLLENDLLNAAILEDCGCCPEYMKEKCIILHGIQDSMKVINRYYEMHGRERQRN